MTVTPAADFVFARLSKNRIWITRKEITIGRLLSLKPLMNPHPEKGYIISHGIGGIEFPEICGKFFGSIPIVGFTV